MATAALRYLRANGYQFNLPSYFSQALRPIESETDDRMYEPARDNARFFLGYADELKRQKLEKLILLLLYIVLRERHIVKHNLLNYLEKKYRIEESSSLILSNYVLLHKVVFSCA